MGEKKELKRVERELKEGKFAVLKKDKRVVEKNFLKINAKKFCRKKKSCTFAPR